MQRPCAFNSAHMLFSRWGHYRPFIPQPSLFLPLTIFRFRLSGLRACSSNVCPILRVWNAGIFFFCRDYPSPCEDESLLPSSVVCQVDILLPQCHCFCCPYSCQDQFVPHVPQKVSFFVWNKSNQWLLTEKTQLPPLIKLHASGCELRLKGIGQLLVPLHWIERSFGLIPS